jgi:actin-related protein 9
VSSSRRALSARYCQQELLYREAQRQSSSSAPATVREVIASAPTVKVTEAPRDTDVGEDDGDIADKVVDDEGVLDVASIVASGKTQEFLAAQEKKKAAAASRKAAKDAREAADAAAAKPIRLPNSKREKVMFHYQERKAPEELEEATEKAKQSTNDETQPKKETASEPAPVAEGTNSEAPPPAAPNPPSENAIQDPSISVEDQAAKREQIRAAKREEKRKAREGQVDPGVIRREVEVGTERFQAASGGILDAIADAVHGTVLSVEVGKRSDLWDSLIIVGNGCKVRGKEGNSSSTNINAHCKQQDSKTPYSQHSTRNTSSRPLQLPSSHRNYRRISPRPWAPAHRPLSENSLRANMPSLQARL